MTIKMMTIGLLGLVGPVSRKLCLHGITFFLVLVATRTEFNPSSSSSYPPAKTADRRCMQGGYTVMYVPNVPMYVPLSFVIGKH
ncbi:hypothetical protein F4774DRAFT_375417 [Daldinia eschscholtzii]|nr:hypothetical protein F4774DRAFT_375417 [Daldinia eschscholtzii]